MLNSGWRMVCCGVAMVSMVIIAGCGGSSGGAADLNTVSVTATSASTNIDGDVASNVTQVDTNGDGVLDGYTYSIPAANSVDVAVKSTVNTTGTSVSSNIRVESVAVTYVRKYATAPSGTAVPIIATRVDSLGQIIVPGGSVTIPVRVVTQEMKIAYADALIQNFGDIYAYDVTLTFNVVEVSTGKTGTVSTSLVVRMANFADA